MGLRTDSKAVCETPLAVVLTSSTSFASSQSRKLIRSAARPLPTEIASLDFGGGPFAAHLCRFAALRLQQAALRLSGGRPDESAARVHRGKRGGHPPVRPSHHAASRRGPLPLTGGVRAASGPQRRPAGGETYSKQNSSFRSGFAAASRLRLAAEGGAEGAEGDRTVPVRRSAAKRQQGDHTRRAWWKGRTGQYSCAGAGGAPPRHRTSCGGPSPPFRGRSAGRAGLRAALRAASLHPTLQKALYQNLRTLSKFRQGAP